MSTTTSIPSGAPQSSADILAELRPGAVIFDLDGTLVDNMELHAEAFAQFLARRSMPPLGPEDRARLDGKRNSEIFPLLLGRELEREELLALEDEKESHYRQVSRGRLRPLPGLEELLRALASERIPIALATSAPAPNVTHSLAEIGLSAAFPVIVRGDQVPRGKPHPDVFLAAAGQVGVEPARCLVFEDAPAGIAAARRAGMACVALTTSFSAEELMRLPEPPHAAFPDFTAFLAGPGRWLVR